MAKCTWCKRKWKKCVESPCIPGIVFRPRQNGKGRGMKAGPAIFDEAWTFNPDKKPQPLPDNVKPAKEWWCSCRDGYICHFHSLRMGQENLKNMKQDQRPAGELRIGNTVRWSEVDSETRFVIDAIGENGTVEMHNIETNARYFALPGHVKYVDPAIDPVCRKIHGDDVPAVDCTNECHNDNHDPGCTCDDGLLEECDGSFNCPAAHHIEGCYSDEPETLVSTGPVESWVEEAQRIVSGSRTDDYGKAGAEDTTERIAAAWSAYLGPKLNSPIDARDFCWMMQMLKGIRDTNKRKRDNGVDAHGYLILMEKHSDT